MTCCNDQNLTSKNMGQITLVYYCLNCGTFDHVEKLPIPESRPRREKFTDEIPTKLGDPIPAELGFEIPADFVPPEDWKAPPWWPQ